MIITEILEFKYSYKVYVDEEYIGILRKKTLKKNHLAENQIVDDFELLKKLIADDEYESGKNKILRQLGFSQKTEKEVFQKLEKDCFSENTINKVMVFLKEYNLLNDTEFANHYTNKVKRCGKSKQAIKYSLIKKGFNKELITDSLNEITEDEEYENALKLGMKKIKTIKNKSSLESAKKLKLYLTYKGFSYTISDKVVKKLIESTEYDI